MELRPYQVEAIDQARKAYMAGHRKVLLHMATGSGKCHGKGTKILMHNGDVKNVENIAFGDLLMGPDSKPRRVLSLASGREEMFRVVPVKGEIWTCNRSHILSLVHTETGKIVNISVEDYLKMTCSARHYYKLYRSAVEFPSRPYEFDPYAVGIYIAEGTHSAAQITNPDPEVIRWLYAWAEKNGMEINNREGRGCRELGFRSVERGWFKNYCGKLRKHCTAQNNRWIPREYLINDRETRLQVLAGLLDGDGYLHNNHYEILTKHVALRDDILFLARSLGKAAYVHLKFVNDSPYWRISISGHLDDIPCKIKRKQATPRRQKKNVLRTGFSLESYGEDPYFGFELDGDGLYLLGDFTVTHNTKSFCEILKKAHEKGTKCLVVVRGRKLIHQASERLKRENVPHGIIMSGKDAAHHENILVCSIDTLFSRKLVPPAGLIVIDEAHQTSGDGYKWFLDQYPKARILAVTATPHLKGGMRHVADVVVYPITVAELTRQGFLVPLEYWAPERPDLSDVKTTAGDYNQKDLGKAMRRAALSGNLVKNYVDQGSGKALVFAVDVEHSKQIVQQFLDVGIPTEHLDASYSDKDREAAIERLSTGVTQVISNVGILTTGVDIPPLEVIIMARPTKSYNLWIQMVGRGTRPFEGKTMCRVYDHASNIEKHGLLEHEMECCLDGKPPSNRSSAELLLCELCYAIFAKDEHEFCPRCGNSDEESKSASGGPRKKDIDESQVLKKVEKKPVWWSEYRALLSRARSRNWKPAAIWIRMEKSRGKEVARQVREELKKEDPWYDPEYKTPFQRLLLSLDQTKHTPSS